VLALISDGLAWADRDEGSGKLAISHVNRHNALPTHDCSAGLCNPRGHLPLFGFVLMPFRAEMGSW